MSSDGANTTGGAAKTSVNGVVHQCWLRQASGATCALCLTSVSPDMAASLFFLCKQGHRQQAVRRQR